MHKEYQAKNPPASKVNGGPRAAQTSSSDPLQGEVVKLYEDFTNVLITKVSSASSPYPAWPDLKEYIFNCTYTHVDPSNERGNPSASFHSPTRGEFPTHTSHRLCRHAIQHPRDVDA